MNLKLSQREKNLLLITGICVLLFLYWVFLLDPVLTAMGRTSTQMQAIKVQSDVLKAQLKQLASLGQNQPVATGREGLLVYPQAEQFKFVTDFIDLKFRWFGMELNSLSHSFREREITKDKKVKEFMLELGFDSTYYQLLGFLNSLEQIKTILIVEKAQSLVNVNEGKIRTKLILVSPYL